MEEKEIQLAKRREVYMQKPIQNCNMFDYEAPAGRWEDITERCYGSTLIKKTHVAFILAETHAVSYIFQEV